MKPTDEILELLRHAAELPWEELSAKCRAITPEAAAGACAEAEAYYQALPWEARFYARKAPEPREVIAVKGWRDWTRALGARCSEPLSPLNATYCICRIAYLAGPERWLAWLDRLPSDEERAAVLSFCGESHELIPALEAACGGDRFKRVRTILFCHLLLSHETPRQPFLDAIERNRDALAPLCVEVLSDFGFTFRYKNKGEIYEAIAGIYAGAEVLPLFEASENIDRGVLFAWARVLAGLEKAESERIKRFTAAYLHWVKATKEYSFNRYCPGTSTLKELEFASYLAEIFASAPETEPALERLWVKKPPVYFSWSDRGNTRDRETTKDQKAAKDQKTAKNQETIRDQGWFQHLGLLLWMIGCIHWERNGDLRLANFVAERLNDFITMALSELEYDQLLFQVFCFSAMRIPEMNNLLARLVNKIYSREILCILAQNCLEQAQNNRDILCLLRARLELINKLPQPGGMGRNTTEAINKLLAELHETPDPS